jgi:DNA-directed RNA polymerase subunit RPC12/RpoP
MRPLYVHLPTISERVFLENWMRPVLFYFIGGCAEMADQSRPKLNWKCMRCGHVIHISRQKARFFDGATCEECGGPISPINPPKTPVTEKSKPISELTVKVNIDCSDALKGLKAVQREIRKTVVSFKDLQSTMADVAKQGGIHTGITSQEIADSLKVMSHG